MHVMSVNFLAGLVAVIGSGLFPKAAAAGQMYSIYHDVGTDDVIFTDDLVFESSAWSDMDCARQCSRRDGCVASTYTKGSGATTPGTCRGHPSVVMTSSSALASGTNDTKTYRQAGASGEREREGYTEGDIFLLSISFLRADSC